MSWLCCLCLFTCGGVKRILCCGFVLFFFVLCTQCCLFLWIVPSVFSKVYSLRRDVLAHETSLTPPLLIEMLVPIQESERWSCICALWVSILPLSMILILDVGIVPIVWYFCFVFHFYLRHLLRNYCEVNSR
jgi:hypothetical protein